ncbi:MAG: IclR family transcriptional regulator [Castellaniella sp.]|uniref:IclR family transcriptional regulator n=1 Tax=Castellaniella sp. TaxID=1955812 RepID=UPI003C714B4E
MSNTSTSSAERCLAILELLVEHDRGLEISAIARRLVLPLSATHRLLQALIRAGYARQDELSGLYSPTLKIGALGLRLLADMQATDVAQPLLDDLARQTGELVRLAVVEGGEMIWLSKAQGATSGIRCDSISGRHVPLHTTAMGKAWLASMPEDQAVDMVLSHGFHSELLGPNAVTTEAGLREKIRQTRAQGFGLNEQESELGLSGIAMLIHGRTNPSAIVGAVSIAGPAFRVDQQRLLSFAGPLRSVVEQLQQVWPE